MANHFLQDLILGLLTVTMQVMNKSGFNGTIWS
jgi:hypothetical protein